jgi:lysozyme
VIKNIIDQLKRDEGFRPNIYIDTVGKRTCGYGHNLDANPLPDQTFPINEIQATQILGKDIERISMLLQNKLPWIITLDEARHGCLQNLAFNMGVMGLLGFHKTLAAVQSGDYNGAAQDLQASVWYTQVGDRAKRLVQQMLTGQWQ